MIPVGVHPFSTPYVLCWHSTEAIMAAFTGGNEIPLADSRSRFIAAVLNVSVSLIWGRDLTRGAFWTE